METPNIQFAEGSVMTEIETTNKAIIGYRSRVDVLSISTDEDLGAAGKLLKEVRDYIKNIDRIRTALVKPLNDHVKNINDQFRPLTDASKETEDALSLKMKSYNDQQKVKRDAEAKAARDAETARLREEAEKLAAAAVNLKSDKVMDAAVKVEEKAAKLEAAPVKVQTQFVSGESKTNFAMVWRFEVVDPRKVPIAYMEISDKKIKDAIKSGLRDIPGIRIFEDSVIKAR
jgi:hypothetical protein